MKKLLVFAMTGVMVLGLTACGGGGDITYDVDIDELLEDEDGEYVDYEEEGEYDSEEQGGEEEYYGDSEGVPDDVEFESDSQYLTATFEGENGDFAVGIELYDDGSYMFYSEGGEQTYGSYYFDGEIISMTPNGGGAVDSWYYEGDKITNTGYDMVLYALDSDAASSEGSAPVGQEDTPPYPPEEYNLDPEITQWIVGKWEGELEPPPVWFIFTEDGDFYCNRDNGYLEKGTYLVHSSGNIWLRFDGGDNLHLFNFDEDRLTFELTDGLNRTSTDDTVEQWILDEF